MKRCPQCNRVESDDSLAFCRTDGTALVHESGAVAEASTAKFASPALSSEIETSVLPHRTDAGINGSTAATTVLPGTATTHTTNGLTKPRRRGILFGFIALLILVVATGGYFYSSRKMPSIQSIAVMPFVNASGNVDFDYLSDGMTETLIKSLSQLPNLNVKARSTVFRYKGKDTDAKTIGKELRVPAILNGWMTQHGDQLTLNLELIDTQTENVIWTDHYDRKLSDLVALQTEIARDVSSKLKVKLSGVDAQKIAKTDTLDPEAYRFYLQGRFYWNKREEKDFRKAVDYFNQAIALDQNYALAYAGLADAYALLATFGFMPPPEGVPKARVFANRALSLDAGMAEPHTTLAYLSATYDYDFVAAEPEYKRALELNPNYATAHQWFAEMLVNSGRFDEAASELRRALDLEPLSLPINWDYGRFLYMSRRYDESIVQHKKTIDLDPGFARAHRTLAEVYRMKGDYENAVEERAKFFELIGQAQSADLIRETFSKTGWVGYLRLVIAETSALKEGNNNWVMAKAYLDLGEREKPWRN